MSTLPAHSKRSPARDRGDETARRHESTPAADVPVHFRDPAAPWWRGSNENTNGPRRYFPEDTRLSRRSW